MRAESIGDALVGVDIVLRDGSTVHVRPICGDDLPAVRAFLAGLSEESRWFRFFSAAINVERAAAAAVDAQGGLSLIVLTGAEGRVIGQGSFVPLGAGRAEVAFAIADAWQEHGIATILLGASGGCRGERGDPHVPGVGAGEQ